MFLHYENTRISNTTLEIWFQHSEFWSQPYGSSTCRKKEDSPMALILDLFNRRSEQQMLFPAFSISCVHQLPLLCALHNFVVFQGFYFCLEDSEASQRLYTLIDPEISSCPLDFNFTIIQLLLALQLLGPWFFILDSQQDYITHCTS